MGEQIAHDFRGLCIGIVGIGALHGDFHTIGNTGQGGIRVFRIAEGESGAIPGDAFIGRASQTIDHDGFFGGRIGQIAVSVFVAGLEAFQNTRDFEDSIRDGFFAKSEDFANGLLFSRRSGFDISAEVAFVFAFGN